MTIQFSVDIFILSAVDLSTTMLWKLLARGQWLLFNAEFVSVIWRYHRAPITLRRTC